MDRSPVVIMLYLIFQIKINRELPLIPRNVPLPTPLTLLPSLPLDFQARERVRESDRQTPAESCDMFLGPSWLNSHVDCMPSALQNMWIQRNQSFFWQCSNLLRIVKKGLQLMVKVSWYLALQMNKDEQHCGWIKMSSIMTSIVKTQAEDCNKELAVCFGWHSEGHCIAILQ